MRSQVVRPAEGWLLVGPTLVRWLLSAAEPTLARIAREGGRLPPDVATDLEALRAVCGPVVADPVERSWITTHEAAGLLEVSVRTVQRMAKGWACQTVAGALLVDADDVAAELVARHARAGRTTPGDTARQADELAA